MTGTRKCGLVRAGVALLKEMYHLRWASGFQMLKSYPVGLFLLPPDQDTGLSVTLQHHVCLCVSVLPAMRIMN